MLRFPVKVRLLVLALIVAVAVACGAADQPAPGATSLWQSVPSSGPSARPITLPTNVDLSVAPGGVVAAWVGQSRFFVSSDHGDHWTEAVMPPGAVTFAFSSKDTGLAVGGSPAAQCQQQVVGVYRTQDGGRSWLPVKPSGIDPARCKDRVTVTSAGAFLAAWSDRAAPVIYRTTDGGATWTASEPLPDPPGQVTSSGGATLRPYAVAAFGDTLLAAAMGWQHRYVYRSLDRGAHWQWAATAADSQCGVSFIDATTWWNGRQMTVDGGATWTRSAGYPSTAAPICATFAFEGTTAGYATVRGTIWRTGDGGATWQRIPTPGVE